MTFNKIKYAIAIVVIMQAGTSCKKDFLEVAPRGTALEGNFYKTDGEVYQGLIATYDVMQWGNSGGYLMIALLAAVMLPISQTGSLLIILKWIPGWVRR